MSDALFFFVVWFGALALLAVAYGACQIGQRWWVRRRQRCDVRPILLDLAAHDRERRARLRRLR